MKISKSIMSDVLDISEEDVIVEDEDSDVSNSFFETRYHGVRVLVLVPHPDDEINVAGNMILNLTRARAEVFVAYTTNGDFETAASIRAKEAEESLNILGVKRDNIIFLGYGDTYNGTGNPHIFFAETPTNSPAGKCETYAAGKFIDYSFSKRGEHSKYTRQNFLSDVKELILDIEADVIFCVDFDKHSDHRMLSLMFEQAISEILSRPDNTYKPEIYKRFAYSTAFSAIRDFYADNLKETKRPTVGAVESYDFDIINHANYVWEERIRFPISEDCRVSILGCNPIANAVFCHKSQRNEWNALGILNSDEVYFERRTDNLIYTAEIEVTSGNFERVKDFHIINTDDVDTSPPKFTNYLWRPTSNDPERRLNLTWKCLQQIEQIRIYGSISQNSGIDKLNIKIGDDCVTSVKMPNLGVPLVINFPDKLFANQIEFAIIEFHGDDYGIAEIEIFETREPSRIIKPFIKITIEDNFAYDYFVPRKVNKLSLNIYRFHIDKPVEFIVNGGDIERDEDKLILYLNSDNVIVRAEISEEPSIFDQIRIIRVNQFYFWRLKLKQLIERLKIHLRRKFKQ